MPYRFDPGLSGRRIRREREVELIRDEKTGEVFRNSFGREISEGIDGTISQDSEINYTFHGCPHLIKQGQIRIKCEQCTKKKKIPVLICHRCAVLCEICGRYLCKHHTYPTPYGDERFCKRCRRRGLKLMRARRALDLEAARQNDEEMLERSPLPVYGPGLIRRFLHALLSWW